MDVTIEYLVAGNPLAASSVLWTIYEGSDWRTRSRLAENPSTPFDLLLLLAVDPSPEVRARLACNLSTPIDLLEDLSLDEDVNVRLALAEERRMPIGILHKLCEDSNPYVCDVAQDTLESLAFEKHLRAEGYVHEPGLTARLGDLLTRAGLLPKSRLEEYVRMGNEQNLPLGFILVRERVFTQDVITRALKLQSRIRRGKITVSAALEELRSTTDAD